jgi:hypothetical protein
MPTVQTPFAISSFVFFELKKIAVSDPRIFASSCKRSFIAGDERSSTVALL